MTWEVFYTPHTDDESIAMAGAITRARDAGHETMVVLVTNNCPSAYMERVWERDDLAQIRRIEWTQAMKALDVTELRMWDIEEDCISQFYFNLQGRIEDQMIPLEKELHPVHHHTVWGLNDIHQEVGHGSLSHGLCANALSRLAFQFPIRATLYGVYVYSWSMEHRRAPNVSVLTEHEFHRKMCALNCYRRDESDPVSIGYGYRSVPELIDNASRDPREFTIDISHDHGIIL